MIQIILSEYDCFMKDFLYKRHHEKFYENQIICIYLIKNIRITSISVRINIPKIVRMISFAIRAEFVIFERITLILMRLK